MRSQPKYRHGVGTLLETFGGGQHGVNPRTLLDAGNTESTQVSSRSRYTARDYRHGVDSITGRRHGVDTRGRGHRVNPRTVLEAGNTESAQVSSRSRYTARDYRHGVDSITGRRHGVDTRGRGHRVSPRTVLEAGNTESAQVSSRSRYTARGFRRWSTRSRHGARSRGHGVSPSIVTESIHCSRLSVLEIGTRGFRRRALVLETIHTL
ncbi:hypothetical protein BDD12DRAFT_925570 [Trichophaea hybrida]|nr:hypothetical protein BDD12DRAFT_925570 [Trichophaea hybrida]